MAIYIVLRITNTSYWFGFSWLAGACSKYVSDVLPSVILFYTAHNHTLRSPDQNAAITTQLSYLYKWVLAMFGNTLFYTIQGLYLPLIHDQSGITNHLSRSFGHLSLSHSVTILPTACVQKPSVMCSICMDMITPLLFNYSTLTLCIFWHSPMIL